MLSRARGAALTGRRWASQAPVLRLANVGARIGEDWLFQGVDLKVKPSDRVVVVGGNGIGKSTLNKMIVGEEDLAGGQVQYPPGLDLGYLPQDVESWINNLPLESVGELIANECEGDTAEAARQLATALALPPDGTSLRSLSGGQKTKLLLCTLRARCPDLLVLDEPSNNLDSKGMEWLVSWLRDCRSAMVVVSHDHGVLEGVPGTDVYELGQGGLTPIAGHYMKFLEEEVRREEDREKDFKKQMKNKAKVEARQAKLESRLEAREDRYERLAESEGVFEVNQHGKEKMEKAVARDRKNLGRLLTMCQGLPPPDRIPRLNVKFRVAPTKDEIVIACSAVKMGFVEKKERKADTPKVLNGVDLAVRTGERVVIHGANGTGKTTLLKILAGEMKPQSGKVRAASRLGYMNQQQETEEDKNVLQYLRGTSKIAPEELLDILEDMCGIPREAAELEVGELSTGQRRRLQFGRMVTSSKTVILLDEPTNHLDTLSRVNLERALINYGATMIAATHDTTFADSIATRKCLLNGGTLTALA